MNRAQANRMLSQLKAGEADYSAATITALLHATGDIDGMPVTAAPLGEAVNDQRVNDSLRARAILETT